MKSAFVWVTLGVVVAGLALTTVGCTKPQAGGDKMGGKMDSKMDGDKMDGDKMGDEKM